MSSNNTTATAITSGSTIGPLIAAYYALFVIIFGTLFNVLTFIILCRSKFRDTRARPTLHYMRAMAIFDILMLYGWNLNNYLTTAYQFHIFTYSMVTCRFLSFLSYYAPQTSAWLRVFVCLDRYLSLSRLHKTWFSKSKHVLIIIGCILTTLLLLNFHFFLFVCYYKPNGKISVLSWLYSVYPLWDSVNLGVYNFAPFILMMIFNSGVIYHLIQLRRTTTVHNSRIQHRAISITLVITTFLFLLMTVPSSVAFAFFSSADTTLLNFLDGLLYSYHILSFPLYMITFDEFRQECIAMILCKKNNQRIAPHGDTVPQTIQRTHTMKNT